MSFKSIQILVISFASLQLSGCVHGTRLKGESKPDLKNEKNAQAAPTEKKKETATAKKTDPAKINLSKVDIPAIVLRLAGPTPNYSSNDKIIVDALVGHVKPGSYEEAAVALAVILESMPLKEEGYEEADLYPQNQIWKDAVKKARKISIESNAEKRKIDIPSVLALNPLLQSYRIQSLALNALSIAYTSEEFRTKLKDGVNKKASFWASLGNPVQKNTESTAKLPGNADKTDNSVQPALPFGASNFGSDDSILQLAQTLADRGQFSKAVAKLDELKENSPLYAEAQEKIRETSNRAVQRLRRLAAKAFQSAIPVSDLKAKSTYLNDARKYLETALNNFPNADQLSTVRENLAVINRDLLSISNSLESAN
jgi:tetratricopeptide (TPR) repeat protein